MGRGQGKDPSSVLLGGKNRISKETESQEEFVQPEGPTPGSSFGVYARTIEIKPHDNADALELAVIDDYTAIVLKGEYKTGDLALYIPEQAILPEPVIQALGLEGKLAGGTLGPDGKKNRDRVKAIRLRGVLSQGLVYKPDIALEEGKNYAEDFGIEKWAPPIPAHLAGDVEAVPKITSYTSIENIKKFPDILEKGEEVVFTEKLHGTCTIATLIQGPEGPEFHVSSKGNAARGRALKRDLDDKGQDRNAYWRMSEKYGLKEKLEAISEAYPGQDVYIFGETLGVQDLNYGLQRGDLDFRAFDIKVGHDFLDYDEFAERAVALDMPVVPLLYRGPYDKERIEELATGKEQYTGDQTHIREGGVVKPIHERLNDQTGRTVFKVISPDYLLRKGDATEYE